MLLRGLFQFDCADLDFGIYRIMNGRRDVIERFNAQDPPKSVAKELDLGVLADQSRAAKALQEVAEQIAQTLGKEALEILVGILFWRFKSVTMWEKCSDSFFYYEPRCYTYSYGLVAWELHTGEPDKG